MFKGLLQASILTGHQRVIHNSRKRDTKQPLCFCIVFPDLTKVWELSVGGLDGAKDRSQTYLLRESIDVICGSYYNLCKVTELVRAQDDL